MQCDLKFPPANTEDPWKPSPGEISSKNAFHYMVTTPLVIQVCVCDRPAPQNITAQFLRVRLAFEDGYPENAENPGGQRTIYPRLQDP